MFYCEITGKLSKPLEKMNKVTVQTRQRVYTQRVKNEETREWETVEIGHGWEIVKQLNASEEGVREWLAMTDDQRSEFLTALKSV